MWPWSASEPPKSTKNGVRELWDGIDNAIALLKLPRSVESQVNVALAKAEVGLESFPRLVIAAGCFCLGGLLTTSIVRSHSHRFKRLQNGEWITPDWLNGRRWVKGYVIRVGDGDNFRLFHTPFFGGHHWPLRFRTLPTTRAEMAKTLHVRLAGVDAPEASHFGKPAQPYATESIKWLTDTILHRRVYCQLIRRDQYSRVVANVYLPRRGIPVSLWKGQNLSLEMLKAGWATVYSQSGAEYGSVGEETFKKVEQEAKKARRGIWADGELKETPAEYKKRTAQSSPPPEAAPPIPPQARRLRSKLFGRS